MDSVTSSGNPFWSGAKRPPTPLVFDASDSLHMDFVKAAAVLRAANYGIKASKVGPNIVGVDVLNEFLVLLTTRLDSVKSIVALVFHHFYSFHYFLYCIRITIASSFFIPLSVYSYSFRRQVLADNVSHHLPSPLLV